VRELGGFAAADGRVTRFGELIRAGNLSRLTETGRDALLGYGVRTVIDVRDPKEFAVEHDPFQDGARWAGQVHYLNVPLISEEEWTAVRDPEQRRQGYRTGRNALVFSGGGIKFATHVGVMAEMASWSSDGGVPWLSRFPVLVGTSAGALYAALYASGLTPAQIALFASFFADPAIGPRLFDRNIPGVAAAFLRYDPSYALGLVRGFAIQTLLETVFSMSMHATLRAFDPAAGPEAQAALRTDLIRAWERRRAARRDASYFTDQLTFEHTPDLFIISVNAYTGQKTVFTRRPNAGEKPVEKAEDDAMYESSRPCYLNPPSPETLASTELALAAPEREPLASAEDALPPGNRLHLDFRRFENRVYRAYDTGLYGTQLPLALAVRASISIPFIFEPLRIKRLVDPPDPPGAEPLHVAGAEDLFIDGGVDDNFSVSVALDQHLGAATNVFGIALGNFGYRLADARADDNIANFAMKSTGFIGDAVQDLERRDEALAGHYVTVVDALSASRAQVNDTNLIVKLIDEGRAIAKEFWVDRHDGKPYPTTAPGMSWAAAFPREREAIFLSPAARGVDPPEKPERQVTRLTRTDVFNLNWRTLSPVWRWVYVAIAAISVGVAAMLVVAVESIFDPFANDALSRVRRPLVWIGLSVVLFVGGVIGLRLKALAIWRARSGS
jgi:predicted acylesterase/phospholipase RssA